MVAVIHSGSSLRDALAYNEEKVSRGLAVCLEAAYYPVDAAELSFRQKLRRLELLAELNQATRLKSVHISLNFDPSERISEALLREISACYLQQIGLGHQPYLLYEHRDSGHPHVHIVMTNIRPDGGRISLHNVGKNQSVTARREIEIRYGLVKAADSGGRGSVESMINIQKVQYGKSGTKRAIGDVLRFVLPRYQYTSLAELNAVLQLYHIVADRGTEDSWLYRHRGLLYRVLDESGRRVGVPIKASLFADKPTLKSLEERFRENLAGKEVHKARIRQAIDLFFFRRKGSLTALIGELKKDGIDTVIHQSKERIYGLTYVDHRTRCIYNSSALGKAYGAGAILQRCADAVVAKEKAMVRIPGGTAAGPAVLKALTDALLVPAAQPEQMDWQLKAKKKKRRRQRIEPA